MCAGAQKPHSTTMEYRKSAAESEGNTELAAQPERGEAMLDQTVRIENWEVVINLGQAKQYLHGEVYGHPHFPDGHTVTTSGLIDWHDDVAVTKSGTIYQLGKRRKQILNTAIPCLSV
jgi:hypothetical protein